MFVHEGAVVVYCGLVFAKHRVFHGVNLFFHYSTLVQ